jgi:hypothetical protein
MPGPAPKPDGQRRRRNASPSTVRLPSSGRTGPIPRWPLDEPPARVWAELWRLPQAVAWEKLHLQRIVARYATKLEIAEEPDASVGAQTEVRQLEDRLGLSPMAMLRLRWEIVDEDTSRERSGNVSSIDDYRSAL